MCCCSEFHPHPSPLDVSHGRVSWLKVAIATHSLLCLSQLPYVVLFSLRLENSQLTSDQAFPDVITLLPWLMCSAFLSVQKWVKLDTDKSSVPLDPCLMCWMLDGDRLSVRRQLISWSPSSNSGSAPRRAAPSSGKPTSRPTAAALHGPDENSSSFSSLWFSCLDVMSACPSRPCLSIRLLTAFWAYLSIKARIKRSSSSNVKHWWRWGCGLGWIKHVFALTL